MYMKIMHSENCQVRQAAGAQVNCPEAKEKASTPTPFILCSNKLVTAGKLLQS